MNEKEKFYRESLISEAISLVMQMTNEQLKQAFEEMKREKMMAG